MGLIIGRTGAEVLQSMLSWQRNALTEEEKAAMIGSMRDASKNTRFASWLETWWSSEEQTDWKDGMPPVCDKTTVKATEANGRGAEGTAVDGLGQVQEYLRRRSDGDVSITGDSKAAALAAAADKSGYTPSWDDMFRMNRQQLEQAARTLSRDESLAPECKAYLMQHLLAARWICAQQRAKQLRRVGKATTSPATVGGRLL